MCLFIYRVENHPYYIRFGEIPENERSGIYKGEVKVGEEIGVSVFEAIKVNGEYRILLPSKLKEEIGFDLYNFIGSTKNKDTNKYKCYLVKGKVVGYGTVNETLLRNIKIIKEIEII